MNKRKKDFMIALSILIICTSALTAFGINDRKCYWEADSPNIEFGYTPALGYNNAEKELNTTPTEGFRYYPITDYLSVKKVLLTNEYVGSYDNKDLNATTIKVRTKNQTSQSYLNDLELFDNNNCNLIYQKCQGSNCDSSNHEMTDAEKWNWFLNHYECHTECHTWYFCAFGHCSENRFCLPKCMRIK